MSSTSDTKEDFRSSQSFNFTNTSTGILFECGTGKIAKSKLEYWTLCFFFRVFSFFGQAVCWSDAEITVIHMVSRLTPDRWNFKAHCFHLFCPMTKGFNTSCANNVCCRSFVLITQFHIKVSIVCLFNKVIHLHALLYNCD